MDCQGLAQAQNSYFHRLLSVRLPRAAQSELETSAEEARRFVSYSQNTGGLIKANITSRRMILASSEELDRLGDKIAWIQGKNCEIAGLAST